MSNFRNRSFGQEPEPKPFFWIELSKNKPVKKEPVFHERFRGLTGRLEVEIEVVSDYLYAGSGYILLDEKNRRAYHAFSRFRDRPAIPGTGIKGAVRSIVEAISNSCVPQLSSNEKNKVGRDHYGCKGGKLADGEAAGSLCPACRLFGTTGYRGRVYFTDALPLGSFNLSIIKIADLWPPRAGKARKFYQVKRFRLLDERPQKNHRFVEAAPKGARFKTELWFENVSGAEMGLVFRALGYDAGSFRDGRAEPAFPVKLGGAKPRCLGAVYFRPVKLIMAADMLCTGNTPLFEALSGYRQVETRDWQETVASWAKEESLLDREAWRKFCVSIKQKEQFCPRELY